MVSPTDLLSLMMAQGGMATAHPVGLVSSALTRSFADLSDPLAIV